MYVRVQILIILIFILSVFVKERKGFLEYPLQAHTCFAGAWRQPRLQYQYFIYLFIYFLVQKKHSFSKCFLPKTCLYAFFVCSVGPPTPRSQTAARCCDSVPIISIYLRHKQSCGKPQKLALLAQLTSTLLHLIPSYHIARPSPCRYRYVEPLTRLQGASKSETSSVRNMKVFIWNEVKKSKKC